MEEGNILGVQLFPKVSICFLFCSLTADSRTLLTNIIRLSLQFGTLLLKSFFNMDIHKAFWFKDFNDLSHSCCMWNFSRILPLIPESKHHDLL